MRTTTLNISSNEIKYVATGSGGKMKYGSVSSEGLINNGLILQPDTIAKQIKTIFTSNVLPRERVICSINGLPFSYRLFTLPKMDAKAFDEAMLRTIRKEMPISPEEMYITWQAYPAEKDEWQVLVAGVTRQPVDTLIKTLQAAGVDPYYLDLQHLALARLTSEKDAIIIEYEKDYSNTVIIVDSVPQALNIIPSLGPQAARQDEVRQIAGKLTQMVDFYNTNHPKKPIKDSAKVFLTGELAKDEKVLESIQQAVTYRVELLTLTQKAISGVPIHEYAANVGSLLLDIAPTKQAGKNAVPYQYINLAKISRELKGTKITGKGIFRLLVPVTVVAGIVALAFAFLFQNQTQTDIDKYQQKLTEANETLSQKQNAFGNTKAIQDNINQIETQIQSIQSNYASVVGSNDYVSDIAAIKKSLPPKTIFTSLAINSSHISVNGITVRGLTVVQFARNLESIGGFSQATIEQIDRAGGEGNYSISFMITIYR
jgi:Tfp pilus assembly PilM family ATPase/Tfp pilus assembly protein PilN